MFARNLCVILVLALCGIALFSVPGERVSAAPDLAIEIQVMDLGANQPIKSGQILSLPTSFQVQVTTNGIDCAGQFVVTALGEQDESTSVLVQAVPFVIGPRANTMSAPGAPLKSGTVNDWKISASCNSAEVDGKAFAFFEFFIHAEDLQPVRRLAGTGLVLEAEVIDLGTRQPITSGETISADTPFQVQVTTNGIDCAGQFVVTALGQQDGPTAVLVQDVPFVIGPAADAKSASGEPLSAVMGNDWKITASCNGAQPNEKAFAFIEFFSKAAQQPVPTIITLELSTSSLPVGETVEARAMVTDRTGLPVPDAEVSFDSLGPLEPIDDLSSRTGADGLTEGVLFQAVEPAGDGTITVRTPTEAGRFGFITATQALEVLPLPEPVAATITLELSASSLRVGETVEARAMVRDRNGLPLPDAEVSFDLLGPLEPVDGTSSRTGDDGLTEGVLFQAVEPAGDGSITVRTLRQDGQTVGFIEDSRVLNVLLVQELPDGNHFPFFLVLVGLIVSLCLATALLAKRFWPSHQPPAAQIRTMRDPGNQTIEPGRRPELIILAVLDPPDDLEWEYEEKP
jgi:hypothetical protein